MEWQQSQLAVLINIALANFDETAIRAKRLKALRDGLTGQRVQHDVHALPVRGLHNFVGEIQRARVHHLLNAERAQILALLFTAGSRKNFSAEASRQLHGGQPDAARGGVNQHPLALPHPAQMMQSIVGRQEYNRDSGRFDEIELRRLGQNEMSVRDGVRAEAVLGKGHHFIAHLKSLHTLA